MADNNSITGSVVGKIRFNIDKKSFDNLAVFQEKLKSIKDTMAGMNKTIKVQAVVQAVDKVANATIKAEDKIAKARRTRNNNNKEYSSWWEDALKDKDSLTKKHSQALRMNEQFDRQISRQKERAEREYDKRREKLLNARARANASRSKRKAGAMSASEAYEARVQAFTTVKRNQLERTALMRGWSDSQKANAQSILTNNVSKFKAQFDGSKSGDIGNFRANVNGAVNQLSAMDAVARRSAISLKSLRNELVQLTAAYTAFSVVQNVAQVGFEFESLRASARVFAKDDAGVADHMAFISEQAQRLGIDLQTATKEFTKFSIATQTTMSKSDQRNLFVSMSEYSRVLGLNKQDYERSFRAVQQIECCLPIQ